MSKKKKEIDLDEINIILRIPENAAEITVSAKLLDKKGKPMKVGRTLSVQDIFKARTDFLENVADGDDYDAKYVLTDEGRAYLERLASDAGRQNY
ncbi:MAG: hypothetical protein IJV40_15730 [Oscillospiraceae bacterium]|nr:hypothetical protein [Oscillospiraceae bacterium]